MICKVKRLTTPLTGNANWSKSPWNDIQSELIQNYMGAKPGHLPKTEVKIAYDDTAIYVIFRVEDKYVRAVVAEHQDCVCTDSCVEFFFTTGSDVSKGYFNLEMNCGGTMLLHFQLGRGKNNIVIPKSECNKIKCSHSLPRIIDPEIEEPTIWTVEYKIPISLLERYSQVTTPEPHAIWRANFYKCADKTSHPHWLTWAPIDLPKPDYHVPQAFGTLEFE
jgi:hypothetical protein